MVSLVFKEPPTVTRWRPAALQPGGGGQPTQQQTNDVLRTRPARGLLIGAMTRLAGSAHSHFTQIMIVLEATLNTKHGTHSMSTTWRRSVVGLTFHIIKA